MILEVTEPGGAGVESVRSAAIARRPRPGSAAETERSARNSFETISDRSVGSLSPDGGTIRGGEIFAVAAAAAVHCAYVPKLAGTVYRAPCELPRP